MTRLEKLSIDPGISRLHKEQTEWRHRIHANPETAFEEFETSDFVAEKLESFGYEVVRGLGKTGLVASLTRGSSKKVIGLRADMDALFIQEENDFKHASKVAGKMHACGHDGHTTMLLGAARYLAEKGKFDGTVRFIFQPAEETGDELCGGSAMIKDGLFERFPVDCVFGLHNFPDLAAGQFSVRKGPMLASIDTFEFKIFSENIHPALQHRVPDPILTASRIVEACHAFKARHINPTEPAILTITQFKCGEPADRQSVHVMPEEAYIRGTTATFNNDIRDVFEKGLADLVAGIAASEGAKFEFSYERGYPPVMNAGAETDFAVSVAQSIVGEEHVEADMTPLMGAEDFAFMLQEVPGCYVFLGNGKIDGAEGQTPCQLHSPHYDFNDEIIPVGTQYWVGLAERYLQA